MKEKYLSRMVWACVLVLSLTATVQAQDKPNIVLINMDNFGYGELGVYGGGITRGAPTPRIDKLASEGLRLTNFNVENQCTPSRAALMTGRHAVRSGNASVPWTTGLYGLTQWEVTMAEMLSDIGYATGHFGKWHLGQTEGRLPTDQGFDEWYGIPNSTDESKWPGTPQFQKAAEDKQSPFLREEYIYESKGGAKPKKVKLYDVEARPEIDREITDRTKDFMRRQAKSDKPFFAYVPYTMNHMPLMVSKEFYGVTGNGRFADALLQIDTYVGELLDTIDELGIAHDTIFIFTSDNGPEFYPGNQGSSGPWAGSYSTPYEGSLRVPFIMRWPGKVPAGEVSDEIVHQADLFTTLARITGGKVPEDRLIDGVDQTNFFLGKTKESAREGFVVYVGQEVFGVKWRNWKMMFKEIEGKTPAGPIITRQVPTFYDLYRDQKEMYPFTDESPFDFWVRWPATKILGEHQKSLQAEPPIKPGTPDPYVPAKK